MSLAVNRTLSLRTRIMMIVVLGAILPLALLGAWLTASGARAGRELLRRELESSLTQVAARMTERWVDRSAEVALLANNAAAHQLLAVEEPDNETTLYLGDVARALRPSIREFSYKDVGGRSRWSTRDRLFTAEGGPIEARRALAGFDESDAIFTIRPVVGERGDTIGVVEAQVLLSAILPTDSVQLIVAGAALRIRNRADGKMIGGEFAPGKAQGVVATQVILTDPPLDLQLAASDARYVAPFAQAARVGFAFLLGVAILAFILTAFLARRLTASVEEMVDAAGAVAAGDLERSVTGEGGTEMQRLAAAFNTMTESLRRTLRDLARGEALAAVGSFAAAISHEVRNALTSVRLDLQRLSERSSNADDRALLHRMLRNVRRLDSIVTGSLRIARADPATMRSIVIEGVVRAAITDAEPTFHESGTRVELESGGPERLRVRGDAGGLEQLLLNLLMNANQAMAPGGVARVSIARVDSRVHVRVTDEGSGISPEVLARMGEPFFSSRPDGTGLGFAIARQIAGAHGGEVNVVSTGPSGTVVQVVLPVEADANSGNGNRRKMPAHSTSS
jgi:signal transduction histidine kinase